MGLYGSSPLLQTWMSFLFGLTTCFPRCLLLGSGPCFQDLVCAFSPLSFKTFALRGNHFWVQEHWDNINWWQLCSRICFSSYKPLAANQFTYNYNLPNPKKPSALGASMWISWIQIHTRLCRYNGIKYNISKPELKWLLFTLQVLSKQYHFHKT